MNASVIKRIDFRMNGIEYVMFFDSIKMTDKQALAECEFVGWGMGNDETLFPYYIIIEKQKLPIVNAIYNAGVEKSMNK